MNSPFYPNPNSLRKYLRYLVLLLVISGSHSSYSQFQINTGANTIDFEGYTGSGFTASPSAGQLDSDQYAVDDDDDGTYDLDFGGTQTAGTFAVGGPIADGSIASTGLFSADLGSSDEGFGIKPSNSFFRSGNGGAVLLQIQNKTGGVITDLTVTFDVLYYNHNRDVTVTFSSSTSQSSGYSAGSYNQTSGATAAWTAMTSGNESITGLSITEDGYYYLKWFFNPAGTGNVDAIALNDIVITPTVLTPSETSTLAAGATSEVTSFSSLTTALSGAVSPQLDASENFDFQLTDDGGSGGDSQPTQVSTITIQQGSGNDFSDWTQLISDAQLDDGAGPTATATSITSTTIVFSGFANSTTGDLGYIDDDASKTWNLNIALSNPTSVQSTLDGGNLVFLVDNSSFTLTGTSSKLATSQSVNSGSTNNAIDVVATDLQFSNVPNTIGTGLDFPITVSAVDVNGNTDLSNTASVTLSEVGTGTLSSTTGLTQNLSSGSYSWSDLIYNTSETFQISADDGGSLVDVNSSSIIAAQAFRSINSGGGTWSTATDWELFDGSNWVSTGGNTPTNIDGPITIQSCCSMTISSAVTADQITIESGATLTHTTGVLTLADQSGESDLVVGGVLALQNGSPTINTGATIEVSSGGRIEISTTAGTTATDLAGTGSSGEVVWNSGAIFDWNVASTPTTQDYFPDVTSSEVPIFRFSQNVTGFGDNSTDMSINGITDVASGVSVTFDGNASSDYVYRDGFTGLGSVTLDANNGSNTISGSNAELGLATLSLNGNTLTIASSSIVDQTAAVAANNGTITVSSGATYDFQGVVLSGTANFTATGSTLETSNTGGITTSLTVSGTQTFGTTTSFIFNGSSAQNTNFPAAITQVDDLTINNSAGVTLDQAVSIDGTLTLTDGVFTTTSSNLPTLSITGSISGGSSTAFVDGPVAKENFSVSLTFPIGDGSDYRPLVLNPTNESTITVEHTTGTPTSGTLGTGLSSISGNRWWNITRSSGSGDISVTLTFDPTEESNPNVSNLRIARLNGGTWEDEGQTGNSSTTVTGDISDVGEITLGSSDSTLPVELLSFVAEIKGNSGHLEWMTASELNNDYFSVERSEDGVKFYSIGVIEGNGTTNEISKYNFIDRSPLAGTSYYRLRQVDFDGQFEHLPTRVVVNEVVGFDVVVAPNPARLENMQIFISSDDHSKITFKLVDLSGKEVYETTRGHYEISNGFKLDNLGGVRPGVYLLKVIQEGNQKVLRVSLQ